MKTKYIIAVALLIVTTVVFSQTANYPFSGPDNAEYITKNDHVTAGLTLDSVQWAFSSFSGAHWHPLTWLSHMVDCQIFGLNPRGHHLVNLAIHIANTILLFFLLNFMTGAIWRSAFVATLFALHPLHVESVAWCAERKDVLSTLFFMISLYCYAAYAKRSELKFYIFSIGAFVFGLMSKPMLVTLPFVLILLDYWPLRRFEGGQMTAVPSASFRPAIANSPITYKRLFFQLILEKVPFLFLTAMSSFMTVYSAHKFGGALAPLSYVPLLSRINNALITYVSYIRQMLWPSGLAVLYSPAAISTGKAICASLVLLCISIIVILKARQKPYLSVGWFWYLGTLVPTIGFVQIGGQHMADRFTYIPLIGLFIMVVWGSAELGSRLPGLRAILAIIGGGILLVCAILSWHQVSYWKDDVTLYSHAVDVTKDNYVAHIFLGNTLLGEGKIDQAVDHYIASIKIRPNLMALQKRGYVYYLQGNYDMAISYYVTALSISPEYADTHYELGLALLKVNRTDEAIDQFKQALKIKPDSATYRSILNEVSMMRKRMNN